MEEHIVKKEMMKEFEQYLLEEERSKATIAKYLHDVQYFINFIPEQTVNKSIVLQYKEHLHKTYAIASVNSMLAALNSFFRYYDWADCQVKLFKVQRQVFCKKEQELTRKEYERLIHTAENMGNKRLSLLIQTLCATGIRASELACISIEALQQPSITVTCKGKTRTIFLPKKLTRKLQNYVKEQGITAGAVFVTRNGKPLDRSNIWKEMKKLCEIAGVASEKVYPHNLRHLFARVFYEADKDIAKLADILGHSSIHTTRIYIISSGEEHRQKVENLHLVI